MSRAVIVLAAIGFATMACVVCAALLMAWALWTDWRERVKRDRHLVELLINASQVRPHWIITEVRGRG